MVPANSHPAMLATTARPTASGPIQSMFTTLRSCAWKMPSAAAKRAAKTMSSGIAMANPRNTGPQRPARLELTA